jgi:hypothetical protein
MASSINASTTAGVVTTADTSGVLNIQTAGTTAISIDASQAVTMAGRTTNPTTISVGNATPSTSGAGITFPATQSASSDVNTLDDYEEGTWTPALSTSTGSISFSSVGGAYTKIGRLVYVRAAFQGTATISSPTGDLKLTSLPFTVQSGLQDAGSTAPYNMLAGAYSITVETINGTTTAYIFNFANGTRSSAHNYFQSGMNLNISLCYQI